ncbi:RHS repeat-associated core domain-containing protein [Candidatus Poribacteria bacterium]|nr:RHS repeat-associated core domain-containing protein [Candidatus Poribacteria bacterium]
MDNINLCLTLFCLSCSYHHTNALGSNIVLTDDNENVLVRYEYDVFGAVRSEVGSSDNARKFTGKEYDADVKLYYYSARYYDPYIGRFTSRDPIGDGLNWYAYTYNNPLKFVDPTGLRPVNDREENALIFTFGEEVGGWLASTIDVQVQDEPIRSNVPSGSNTIIELSSDYDSEDLHWLSVFIHEADHIWQKNTGRHRGGQGGVDYKYTIQQLDTLELKSEEHAQAVQDWFYVSYGLATGWILDINVSTSPFSPGMQEIWLTLGANNLDVAQTVPIDSHSFVQLYLNVHYSAVLAEIRNPNLIPGRRRAQYTRSRGSLLK